MTTASPAALVDTSGQKPGEGDPYFCYTVDQRRGLDLGHLAGGERLYVFGIQPEENRVTVGTDAALLAHGLVGERLHWIGTPPELSAEGAIEATERFRSRHAGVPARIRPLATSEGVARIEIDFAEPLREVTPGRAAVHYRRTRILGGCWINGPLR